MEPSPILQLAPITFRALPPARGRVTVEAPMRGRGAPRWPVRAAGGTPAQPRAPPNGGRALADPAADGGTGL